MKLVFKTDFAINLISFAAFLIPKVHQNAKSVSCLFSVAKAR